MVVLILLRTCYVKSSVTCKLVRALQGLLLAACCSLLPASAPPSATTPAPPPATTPAPSHSPGRPATPPARLWNARSRVQSGRRLHGQGIECTTWIGGGSVCL